MPPVGFEHAIPASKRPQAHVLDRAATAFDFTLAQILILLLVFYSATATPPFKTLPFFPIIFLVSNSISLRQYTRLFYPSKLRFSGIKLSYMFRRSYNVICNRTCSWVLFSTDMM